MDASRANQAQHPAAAGHLLLADGGARRAVRTVTGRHPRAWKRPPRASPPYVRQECRVLRQTHPDWITSALLYRHSCELPALHLPFLLQKFLVSTSGNREASHHQRAGFTLEKAEMPAPACEIVFGKTREPPETHRPPLSHLRNLEVLSCRENKQTTHQVRSNAPGFFLSQ